MRRLRTYFVAVLFLSAAAVHAFQNQAWPQPVRETPEKAPVLSAEEELKTIVVPPGYRLELVAKEPLVQDPIAIDFDADGRLWVLEMPGFMSGPGGANLREPINNVVVLEDQDGDGVMDRRTVFADGLVLPRAFKVLDDGVLVGEPPNLWLMKDADGDLKADSKELVADTYGRAAGSVEHNANSLLWGLDNVMYTSEHDWHLRLKDRKFEIVPTLARGQWGASMDDAGRIYRNVNDAPLFVDLIAAGYYARNPNLVRTRGLYEPLISREESVIWPIRQTRGVNRGYRDQFFRPDGSSITIQGVGTPVIYRGDRLPKELYGDAFITDSTTNLVHRYRIQDDGSGRLKAVDAYAKGEIIASWDERFRPVNMLGAPDGTIYVVDMYRGVVQEQIYWTDFLRDYISARDLVAPVRLGRIWRLAHESTTPERRPALSKASPEELVKTLSHPNGWWRDTAQQLLVQRAERAQAVVPQLKALALNAPDWRTKLHALWTLDGIDAIEPDVVQKALGDPSPDVRASGIRLSERWIAAGGHPLQAAVLKLAEDPSWTVRRQLAATVGELPAGIRLGQALALLRRYGDDAVLVDATLSGLRGLESEALDRLAAEEENGAATDAVTMLGAAVARSGEVEAVRQLLARVTATAAPAIRVALLKGLDLGLPGGAGGRGGRGPGGGRGAPPAKPVALPSEPSGLATLAGAGGDAGELAKRVLAKLDWPGKPVVVVKAPALTPDEQNRFDAGAALYNSLCVGCHQPHGRGQEKLAPSLVESRYASDDPGAAIRILLAGKEGTVGLMPPLGGALNDEQIAAVLTFVRREWGNTGSPVAPDDVTEIRGLTRTRTKPWTDAELTQGRGGRGGGRGQ
jgi:mono/diheme cytochrome c family protein/glucose/arabinose dehydrogenase